MEARRRDGVVADRVASADPRPVMRSDRGVDDTTPTGVPLSCTATSYAGTQTRSIRVKRDGTPPSLVLNGGPRAGQSYDSGTVPAAPSCSADDLLSGLDGDCTVTGYSTEVGEHTLTATATDIAGKVATRTRTYAVVDPTPPVIRLTVSLPDGQNGWYRGQTTLDWSAIDPESPIIQRSGCSDYTTATDTTGTEYRCSATSAGGTSEQSFTFKLDRTPPALNVSGGPSEGGNYVPATLPPAPTCSATDATSGVDGDCLVDGYSAEVGEHTITVPRRTWQATSHARR